MSERARGRLALTGEPPLEEVRRESSNEADWSLVVDTGRCASHGEAAPDAEGLRERVLGPGGVTPPGSERTDDTDERNSRANRVADRRTTAACVPPDHALVGEPHALDGVEALRDLELRRRHLKDVRATVGVHGSRCCEEPGERLAIVAVADHVVARLRRHARGHPAYADISACEWHVLRHRQHDERAARKTPSFLPLLQPEAASITRVDIDTHRPNLRLGLTRARRFAVPTRHEPRGREEGTALRARIITFLTSKRSEPGGCFALRGSHGEQT